MKPIKLQKNEIDIPFIKQDGSEAFTLTFEKTDKNIERIMDMEDEMTELLKKIETGTETNMSEQRQALETIIDSILGKSSFEKMYAQNPFLQTVSQYFISIIYGIKAELEADEIQQVFDQYDK